MKTFKMFSPVIMVKICFAFILLFTSGCAEPDLEDVIVTDSNTDQEEGDWMAFLQGLEFESSIVVGRENSLLEAIDQAGPGDAIFIEPGTYEGALTPDRPDIQLFGLTGSEGEKVMLTSAGNAEVIDLQDRMDMQKATTGQKYQRPKNRISFISIKRSEICSGIAHYQFEVRLGQNEFDVVRIHRVVMENRPYRPVRTKGEIFMVHGGSQDFDDIFLRPGVEVPNTQNSSPVYLASKNIDVWGIDLGWTLVPEETSDFSFMQDWGIERDARHTLTALSIARLVRALTHQGYGRINLLGFSYGVSVAYTAAGMETQQHSVFRDIKGLIAAEGAMKYAPADEESRVAACIRAAGAKELISQGIFESDNGVAFAPIGNLALTAPDEASPFITDFTNAQFAMFLGASPSGNPPAPFWHFVAGDFVGRVPIGLLYTDPSQWFSLLADLAPYQPQLHGFESSTCQCDEEEVGIDDHLSEIKLPILYIGAGGGYGQQGLYTSSLTASDDISHHIVNKQEEKLRLIDYGHAEIFMGEEASDLVWKVLAQWLIDHGNRRNFDS